MPLTAGLDVTPAAAPAPAPLPGPTSAPGPAVPPPPAAQLVSVISPLTVSPGNHQISLRLLPEGLGAVDATVMVRGNHVVVELSAADPAARQAIGAALPQLRHELGAGGQQATVSLSDSGTGRQPAHTPAPDLARAGVASGDGEDAPQPLRPLTGPAGAPARPGTIDIRL